MIAIVKLNNINKFVDKETGEQIKKYDPNNKNLQLVMKLEDGSELRVDSAMISIQYGGQISFTYQDTKYVIEDGYRDSLCKAGYIVYDKYDAERIDDKESGVELREKLMNNFINLFSAINNSDESEFNGSFEGSLNDLKYLFETESYRFTVYVDTVNSIVTKNQERSKNNLAFYPFDKNMDKYGTLYLSIFAEKKENAEDYQGTKRFEIADMFTNFLIKKANNIKNPDVLPENFKFAPVIIKKKVLNWEGI